MECTIATLVACFSWANLYLGASVEVIDQPTRSFTDAYYDETLYVIPTNGTDPFLQRNVIREFDSSNRRVNNPYAGVSLGYEVDMNNIRIDLSGFYRESAHISDNAEIGASLQVRWFPLRRRH